MIGPGAIMKLMSAKNKFAASHPKFVAFLTDVFGRGVESGTIIEVKVIKPGSEPIVANMKVQPSDLELLNELKKM